MAAIDPSRGRRYLEPRVLFGFNFIDCIRNFEFEIHVHLQFRPSGMCEAITWIWTWYEYNGIHMPSCLLTNVIIMMFVHADNRRCKCCYYIGELSTS